MTQVKSTMYSGEKLKEEQLARVQPNSIDLENAIIGSILLEKEAIHRVIEIIKTPDYFYNDLNRSIYSLALKLNKENKPIDLLTISEEYLKTGSIEDVHTIVSKVNSLGSTAHLEDHCKRVAEKYISRRLILLSTTIIQQAYDPTYDSFELLDRLESDLSQLSITGVDGEASHLSDVALEVFRELDSLRIRVIEADKTGDVAITGIPTGEKEIDKLTGGWQNGNLIILAARPAVGKTALALKFAKSAAINNYPTAIFSLEMGNRQLVKRILSSDTKITLEDIRDGRLSQEDMYNIADKYEGYANIPLYFDDTATMSYATMKSKARRLHKKYGLKFLIIDYLQLMSGKDKGMNREQEISAISRNLKILAKELNIPIIALSQLSRGVEQRGNKVPQLSDLRESGAIEQDADDVIFVYRPDAGMTDEEVAHEEMQSQSNIKGKTVLKWAKHRNGRLDEIGLYANLSIQTFSGELNHF